jgi:hypothetical protein
MRKALCAFLLTLTLIASPVVAQEAAPAAPPVPEAAWSLSSIPVSPGTLASVSVPAAPLAGLFLASCTFNQCRQPCKRAGCLSNCLDYQTCTCEVICP